MDKLHDVYARKQKLNYIVIQMQKTLSNLFKSFALTQSLIGYIFSDFAISFIEANAQKRPLKQLYLSNTKLCVFAMTLTFIQIPKLSLFFPIKHILIILTIISGIMLNELI